MGVVDASPYPALASPAGIPEEAASYCQLGDGEGL